MYSLLDSRKWGILSFIRINLDLRLVFYLSLSLCLTRLVSFYYSSMLTVKEATRTFLLVNIAMYFLLQKINTNKTTIFFTRRIFFDLFVFVRNGTIYRVEHFKNRFLALQWTLIFKKKKIPQNFVHHWKYLQTNVYWLGESETNDVPFPWTFCGVIFAHGSCSIVARKRVWKFRFEA